MKSRDFLESAIFSKQVDGVYELLRDWRVISIGQCTCAAVDAISG